MHTLEEAITRASKEEIIPGAVLAAKNTSGSFSYAKAFGHSLSSKSFPTRRPLDVDSVFMIASCTKLLTSIAALQCVEGGLFGLNDDISTVLPELAALELLTGFDKNGEPLTRQRRTPITLRHLLTHTAGLGYDFMSPKLQRYRQSKKQKVGKNAPTVVERFDCPLVYEPGTSWMYSPAIDFVGLLVERLTKQSLEEYMKNRIWEPLGIRDLTFWPRKRPDLVARMSSITIRNDRGSGKVVPHDGLDFHKDSSDCFGGGGAYGTVTEYLKVLHSLLANDQKLLSHQSVHSLFSPQLPASSRSFLNSLRDRPEVWSQFIGDFPREVELDWGLGGILTMQATPGWRGKHTLIWSGMPNLFWFIDREVGLCGIYGGQVFPPGDVETGKLITMFEKTMYQRSRNTQNKL